jgi:hypothetical protein
MTMVRTEGVPGKRWREAWSGWRRKRVRVPARTRVYAVIVNARSRLCCVREIEKSFAHPPRVCRAMPHSIWCHPAGPHWCADARIPAFSISRKLRGDDRCAALPNCTALAVRPRRRRLHPGARCRTSQRAASAGGTRAPAREAPPLRGARLPIPEGSSADAAAWRSDAEPELAWRGPRPLSVGVFGSSWPRRSITRRTSPISLRGGDAARRDGPARTSSAHGPGSSRSLNAGSSGTPRTA